MRNLKILKRAMIIGVGAILSLPVLAAVTPGTVKQAVNLTWRSVSMTNVVSGANENITMWTFSAAGGSGGWSWGGNQDTNAPFPGPVLVFREQDMVEYTFNDWCPCENRASNHPYAGHTIHLHGLDVTTLNDGVGETSFTVLPGQSYTYKMGTRGAGSYVYHCHIHTVLHQQMGMYGAIIVMPADSNDQNRPFTGSPDTFTKQYYWVTAEVDKSWHDKASSGDYGDSSQFSYFTQYKPQHFLLSNYPIDVATLGAGTTTPGRGQVRNTATGITATAGNTILIRVGNLGYLNHRVSFGGLKFDAVSTDGKPMRDTSGNLAPMRDLTSIEYGPGERYDLLVKFPTAGTFAGKVEYLDTTTKMVAAGGKAVQTQTITVLASAAVPSPSATISNFWPANAAPGDFIFVFGSNFIPRATKVTVAGIDAPNVQFISSTLLAFMLPPGITTGPIMLTTSAGSATSSSNFGILPTALQITGIWPGQIKAGSVVFVFGSGFDPALQKTKVSINGLPCRMVHVVDPTLLLFFAPAGAVSGPVTVGVNGQTVTSSAALIISP